MNGDSVSYWIGHLLLLFIYIIFVYFNLIMRVMEFCLRSFGKGFYSYI